MFMLTLGSKLIILFKSFNRIFLCMVEISKNEINRLRVIILHQQKLIKLEIEKKMVDICKMKEKPILQTHSTLTQWSRTERIVLS